MQEARQHGSRTCQYATSTRYMSLYLCAAIYLSTFIHFSADDPAPGAAITALLPGWWKVEYGVRTEYYYILKDGRARYTLKAPKRNEPLLVGEGSAYWFQQTDKISFCWRRTCTVDVWTQNSPASDFKIMVNDATSGKAAKLF